MNPISNQEKAYWIALSSTPGIGPTNFYKLLKVFGSAKNAWVSTPKDHHNQQISTYVLNLIYKRSKTINPFDYHASIIRSGIETLFLPDNNYPQLLKTIKNPPPVLYKQGSLKEIDNQAVAVIGTRKPSLSGRSITKNLVKDLVEKNLTIVSGLARGIDGVAHHTALEENGRTIAFIGSGLDRIYPAEHKLLASRIIKQGCLLSEYPPGISPQRGNFLARNRLISGMSQAVLIVESLSQSGTLNTARHAKKQNIPIFIFSSSKNSNLIKIPQKLLEYEAIKISNASEIISYLNVEKKGLKSQTKKELTSTPNSKDELTIIKLLEKNSLSSDEITFISGLDTTKVLITLTNLEIKGLIKKDLGLFQKA